MPLEIRDEGRNNCIDIDEELLACASGSIILRGDGNLVAIKLPFTAQSLSIDICDGSSVRVDAGCFAGMLVIYARRGGTIEIGAETSFNGITRLLAHEPGRIAIGRGCLFGPDIDVVNSDMHSIVDVSTGARINPARDVTIGNRVWIGIKAFLAKGTTIGDGSVIGAFSFVSGLIPAECLAAGVPVKVLRHGVSWQFDLLETPNISTEV